VVFLTILCGVIPFVVGMAYYARTVRSERHSTALPIAFAASVIPPVLLMVYNLISLQAAYNGLCEGPPDYSAPCTYSEYLDYNLFTGMGVFGFFLLCALSFGWTGLVLAGLGFYFRKQNENING
jgi:hypothetical protein